VTNLERSQEFLQKMYNVSAQRYKSMRSLYSKPALKRENTATRGGERKEMGDTSSELRHRICKTLTQISPVVVGPLERPGQQLRPSVELIT